MNKIMYLLFVSIFFLDYLALQLDVISRSITWLPELLSMLVMVIVIFRLAKENDTAFSPKYRLFVFIFLLHILIGFVLNTVPLGAMISGTRNYVKFLPFFLLPMAYAFSESQMKNQVMFLLSLMLLQTPVSLYQRFIQYSGSLSGDKMTGTAGGNSGQLAFLCIGSIAVVLGFYLKGRIRLPLALILIFMFLVPITLGEVKAAIVFLPIAFLIPVLTAPSKNNQGGRKLLMVATGFFAFLVFLAVYDYLITPRWGYGLIDFFAMEGRAENYLYQGADPDSLIGSEKQIGRIDSWVLALKYQSQSFFQLLFGLGAGNVSGSFISSFSGEYADVGAKYGAASGAVTLFMWEIGVVGVLLYFSLITMVARDSLLLSRQSGFSSSFALGWMTVAVLMFLGMFYKKFFGPNATSYLFWYFSGYVAASAYRLRKFPGVASQGNPRSTSPTPLLLR